jgi:GTPase SAR1 family protein
MGAPFAGKTTFITQAVTRFSSAKSGYARSRRNQVYFMRLRPKGARHVGLQLQDTPGGPVNALSPEELRAMTDELEPDPALHNGDERARFLDDPLNPITGQFKTLGFIIMYDVTRRGSFDKAKQLVKAVRKMHRDHSGAKAGNASDEHPIILLANKRDQLSANKSSLDVVSPVEGQRLCEAEVGVYFFYGSSADNEFAYLNTSSSELDRKTWSSEELLGFLVGKIRATHAWELERQRQEQLTPFFVSRGDDAKRGRKKATTTTEGGAKNRGCWCCCGGKRPTDEDDDNNNFP